VIINTTEALDGAVTEGSRPTGGLRETGGSTLSQDLEAHGQVALHAE